MRSSFIDFLLFQRILPERFEFLIENLTMVYHDFSNILNIGDLTNLQLVVDNASSLSFPSKESSSIIDQSIPPLRHVRKLDVRRIHTARKVRKQQQLFNLSSQQYDDEEGEEWVDSFQKLSLPLSPPSRWDSTPKESTTRSYHPLKGVGVYGKETFVPSLPMGWKVSSMMYSSPPHDLKVHTVKSSRTFMNTATSVPVMKMECAPEKLTLVRAVPQRKLSNSPVRMPVRKSSFDCLPKKPVRTCNSSTSRSTTISILDEALSVCDMCNEGANPAVVYSKDLTSSSTRIMPTLPRLTKL